MNFIPLQMDERIIRRRMKMRILHKCYPCMKGKLDMTRLETEYLVAIFQSEWENVGKDIKSESFMVKF